MKSKQMKWPNLRFVNLVLEAISSCGDERSDADVKARKSIELNNDGLLVVPVDELDPVIAQAMVLEDVSALQTIQDPTERYFAAVAMGDSASNQSSYRTMLRQHGKAISAEIDAAYAENRRRTNAKEDRKRESWERSQHGSLPNSPVVQD